MAVRHLLRLGWAAVTPLAATAGLDPFALIPLKIR
jgi:hypothetical protein